MQTLSRDGLRARKFRTSKLSTRNSWHPNKERDLWLNGKISVRLSRKLLLRPRMEFTLKTVKLIISLTSSMTLLINTKKSEKDHGEEPMTKPGKLLFLTDKLNLFTEE